MFWKRDFVVYRGCVLPLPEMRSRMCGQDYTRDEFFFESAQADARRLVTRMGCNPASQVVDIGCGLGRLSIGLIHEVGSVHYWGFDVVKRWVRWCQRHVERTHRTFRFVNLGLRNDAYNPHGRAMTRTFRLPLPDAHADIIVLSGVFTNMRPEDMGIYVGEISRVLKDGGRVFLTAFVETDVPAASINPCGYVDYPLSIPLHVVRYEKGFLFRTFAEHGLRVDEFGYHRGVHCNQSELYLGKVQQ